MDEAHTSSARAKDRDSQPAAAEGESERARATDAQAVAREPLGEVAADSDESAITSGTLEAAALDAAARGSDENDEATARDRAQEATAAGGAEQPLTAASPNTPEERELELDFAAADRYAASIRPSWADPEPPPPPMVQPSPVIGATDGVARVIRHNTRIDLNPPLRKRRGTAFAILGASLLGVAGVLYLGVASSTVDHSAHQRGLGGKAELTRLNTAPVEPETSVQAAQSPSEVPPEAQRFGPRLSTPEPTAENAEEPTPGEPAVAVADPEGTGAEAPGPTEPAAASAHAPEAAQLAAAGEPLQNAAQAEPAAAAVANLQAPEAQPLAAEPAVAAAPQPPAAPPTQPTAAAAPAAAPAPPAPAQAPLASQPAAKLAANPVPELKALQPSAAIAPRPDVAGSSGKVLLSLAAFPPSTRLRVDGLLVENPYKAHVPKSSKHRIDAAAPGFAPETHVMSLEADVQLMISLRREPPRDVKADPYRDAARRTPTSVVPKRDRGAGFVAENPY